MTTVSPLLRRSQIQCTSLYESRTEYGKDEIKYTNILVVGDCGSGRSRFINLMFNTYVAFEGCGITSATRRCRFILGRKDNRMFRVIETIGLQNNNMNDWDTINLIKKQCKHITHFDSVVILLNATKRISNSLLEGLSYLKQWLDPNAQHQHLFTYILTNSDRVDLNPLSTVPITIEERRTLLCNILKLDQCYSISMPSEDILSVNHILELEAVFEIVRNPSLPPIIFNRNVWYKKVVTQCIIVVASASLFMNWWYKL